VYAKAAADGAPQAINVADRFHILQNLTDALQLLIGRSLEEIKAASQTPEKEQNEQGKAVIMVEEWRPIEPAHVEKVRLARRAGRHARYQQVVQLREQGMKPKEIARHLGMGERTVHRWLTSDSFPEAKKRRKRDSPFDPFAEYVLSRWKAGERNGLALWREIQKQGYKGSARSVYAHLATLKQAEVKASANPQRILKYTPNAAVWLFVRDPKSLDEMEQEALAAFCQVSTALRSAYDAGSGFLLDGPQARRTSAGYMVRAGCKQRSFRPSVLCQWSGMGQSRRASGLDLVDQQRSRRRVSDEDKAHQTANVRTSKLRPPASAGSSRPVTHQSLSSSVGVIHQEAVLCAETRLTTGFLQVKSSLFSAKQPGNRSEVGPAGLVFAEHVQEYLFVHSKNRFSSYIFYFIYISSILD